jgi:hypothetical protein
MIGVIRPPSCLPRNHVGGQGHPIDARRHRLAKRPLVATAAGPGVLGVKLVVRGNLEAVLMLTGAKATSGGSPGGICPDVTMQTPPQEYRLQGRRSRADSPADERQRTTGGA